MDFMISRHIFRLIYNSIVFTMRYSSFLGIILALFSIHSCKSWPFEQGGIVVLLLRNNSDYSIACYLADGTNSGFSYPDTLLPSTLNSFVLKEHIKDSTVVLASRCGDFKRLVNASPTQSGVFSLYIFKQEDVEQVGWYEITSKNQYIVRYDLTGPKLDSLRGVICFPPDDSMKGIHMFPSYHDLLSILDNENSN